MSFFLRRIENNIHIKKYFINIHIKKWGEEDEKKDRNLGSSSRHELQIYVVKYRLIILTFLINTINQRCKDKHKSSEY